MRKMDYSSFSDFLTLLPFVQHSLFCDWKQILSNRLCIVHHIAQSCLARLKISPFISRNSNMCRYPHETHFTATSCQFPTIWFTNGWVCNEIFRDSIALIELLQSVKIKYLPSDSLSSTWSIRIAVKTLTGPLIRNPILQFIV
jgi:hypothetical protein